MFVTVLSALFFAGCTDDEGDLPGNPPSEIPEEYKKLQADYEKLKSAYDSLDIVAHGLEEVQKRLVSEKDSLSLKQSELEAEKSKLMDENKQLVGDNKQLTAQKAELEQQIGSLNDNIGSLNGKIGTLEKSMNVCQTSISELKAYKEELGKLLGNTSYKDYPALVEKVLEGLETLAKVDALCKGDYPEGSTIKDYVDKTKTDADKAVESLKSSLGNYVLQTTFDEFKKEYAEFTKTILSATVDSTMEKVEALFAKENENFKNGVMDVVKEAVENGELSVALQKDIKEIEDKYSSTINDLVSRVKTLEDEVTALKADVEKLKNVSGKLDSLKTELAGLKSSLESEKNKHGTDYTGLDERLKACEASIKELEGYKGKLDKLLGSASEESYTGFVEKVLEGLETLAKVDALDSLCAGDYEGSATIKEYIDKIKTSVDKSVEELNASLGKYVLKDAFDEFEAKYKEFKAQVDNNSAGYVKTGDVEALFKKETETFKQGVMDVVKEAVEQGELSEALQKAITSLGNDYSTKVDDLITRVDKLESQVAGLLGRIQSLVYVPKTTDGKIHIGTSYVSAVDESGAETGEKIELSSTKKLEYRVSPAELRDYLLEYEEEVTFSFYQAHVSREGTMVASLPQGLRLRKGTVATRVEGRDGHDGLNEFNVVKVEPGNDAGTLLITVDNEHDFTHEDLAVALCIKQNNVNTGVLTEYTSAYTTVVGEGTNLTGRFYLAKKEADGTYSRVSRTDQVDYTLVYDDTTPIEFMKGFEVVYDNAQTVMSLAEAKKKYEWDGELEYKIKRTGITSGNWTSTSDYTITPSNYKTQTDSVITFQINSNAISSANIGKYWECRYKVSLSKEGKSVDILSEYRADVMVMPAEYVVDAHIAWNSGKWYNGKARGWHHDEAAYASDKASLKYKKDGKDVEASSLDARIRHEIFSDEHPWTISGDVPEAIKVDNKLDVNVATNIQDLVFTVKGYKYSDSIRTVKISRSGMEDGIPTSGVKKISVTGQLTFEGPTANDLNVKIGSAEKPVEMETDPEKYKGQGNGTAYALMYLQLKPTFIPQDKTVPVNSKFFTGGSPFAYATVKNIEGVTCTRSSGDSVNAPETLTLEYYNKAGGRPSPLLYSVNVKSDDKLKSISSETTYTFSKGFDVVLDDGPTVKVTGGTFKFVPSAE